jgi:hypothetical protein
MNHKFDELAKGLAQSVTRRQAFKRFGLGVTGMILVALGLANKGHAQTCLTDGNFCTQNSDCCSGHCNPEWWNNPFGNHNHQKYKVWLCGPLAG